MQHRTLVARVGFLFLALLALAASSCSGLKPDAANLAASRKRFDKLSPAFYAFADGGREAMAPFDTELNRKGMKLALDAWRLDLDAQDRALSEEPGK